MTEPRQNCDMSHDSDATMARHDELMSRDTLLRPYTVAAIALEAGVGKRTVQRWVNKCGDIGVIKNNVPHFSEAEKAQILSHQRNPAPTEEVLEPELIEPGAIELHTGNTSAAAPLVAFNVESIQITLKASDTTALDLQTQQFEQVSSASANAIAQALSAELIGDIAQVRARQKNLAKGIEAQALSNVAKALSGEEQ